MAAGRLVRGRYARNTIPNPLLPSLQAASEPAVAARSCL
uniref:Uncharacterized protein n=1 Tax=Arundo donax TaxID=35708 RepID=A0A0A8YJY7_ARUDO